MMDTLKLIVAGGRDFTDYDKAKDVLDKLTALLYHVTIEVVCGDARGGDTMGLLWAQENNYPVKHFPADWNKHGKSAGYLRNEEMAKYAEACVCFWDGKSRGTAHMIDLAKQYKLNLRVIRY